MPFELRWIVSSAASSLHAVNLLCAGRPLVDQKLAAELAAPAEALSAELAAARLDATTWFAHAIPLSVQYPTPERWAEVVLAKIAHGQRSEPSLCARFAARLAELERATERAHPGTVDELELRSKPLAEQWEARGAGLLLQVGRTTDPQLIVSAADAILVLPASGGGGAAHPLYNSVRIEAVLANPIPHLPEVARLAWLIAQLNLDLPKWSEQLPGTRLAPIGPLSLVAPVLAAAEEVELARFNTATLGLALRVWAGSDIDPSILERWWQTYRESSMDWAVALGALDRMLP
jgi:hypothetical protein